MRKNYVLITILLCTFFILSSCENEVEKIIEEIEAPKAGVILSFDDAYVDEWYDTDQLLKKYDWKATFFVCKINTLRHAQVKKLQQLQKEGHEIGGHGLQHIKAGEFITNHTIAEYIAQEIDPMLNLMQFYGLNVSSFAYPYGSRTRPLDAALIKKFKLIRGRAFYEKEAAKQGCYYNHSSLIFSFSIDDTYNRFNLPHLLKLLEYAKKNNKILILNSHKTVNIVSGDYQTKNKTLEFVCEYVKKHNMKFYTVSDLNNLN